MTPSCTAWSKTYKMCFIHPLQCIFLLTPLIMMTLVFDTGPQCHNKLVAKHLIFDSILVSVVTIKISPCVLLLRSGTCSRGQSRHVEAVIDVHVAPRVIANNASGISVESIGRKGPQSQGTRHKSPLCLEVFLRDLSAGTAAGEA